MTATAWHRVRRRLTSPALVIPPAMSRSPDWLRGGVRRSHGPTVRRCEPREIITCGRMGRRLDRARHRHQTVADRVALRQPTDPAFQSCKLPPLGCTRPQHRLGRGKRHRVVCRQFSDAVLEPAAGIAPTFGPKYRSNPRNDVPGDKVLLHGFAGTEQGAHLLNRDGLAMNGPEPAEMKQTRNAFGTPSIRPDRHRLGAPFTCRASISNALRPVSIMPRCSHCDSGPASRQTTAMVASRFLVQRTAASGALATRASVTIFPCPLTIRIESAPATRPVRQTASPLSRPDGSNTEMAAKCPRFDNSKRRVAAHAPLRHLIARQNQNTTVPARATVQRRTSGQRSYRMTTHCRSFRRPNVISIRPQRLWRRLSCLIRFATQLPARDAWLHPLVLLCIPDRIGIVARVGQQPIRLGQAAQKGAAPVTSITWPAGMKKQSGWRRPR